MLRQGKKYKIVNFNFCILISLKIISLLITHNKERDATAEVEGMSKKPKLLIQNPIGPMDILNAYPGLPVENDCIICINIFPKKKNWINFKKRFGIAFINYLS